MRLLDDIHCLYLDFDSFFAAVEQQLHKNLRGRPIGIIPFAGVGNRCIIACSKEAKACGVKSVMSTIEAKAICPDIIFTPQNPDMYRRAHNALICEIESVLPIATIKSIDELCCDLDKQQRQIPLAIAQDIKRNIHDNIGPYITCSIGFAANRQLAKIACKMDKPNGITIWHPDDMPEALYRCGFDDIPGIGKNMMLRLQKANIHTVQQLYNINPKHMRKLWRNVTGERLWYALHGYDIKAPESGRMMIGHGRVLPPEHRPLRDAKTVCRFLLIKAARRLRREHFYAGGLHLYLSLRERRWSRSRTLPIVHDDQAILAGFEHLWRELQSETNPYDLAFKVSITLFELSPAFERQLDFLHGDDRERIKWERINTAVDTLNAKYGKTVAGMGVMPTQNLQHVGGKIAFTRIPAAQDF